MTNLMRAIAVLYATATVGCGGGDATETPMATGSDGSSGARTTLSSTGGASAGRPPACAPTDGCPTGPDCECVLCPQGWGVGDGRYRDCGPAAGEPCGSVSGLGSDCLLYGPGGADPGVCVFSGCQQPCDCPPGPTPEFDAQVACQDIAGEDGVNECFISCAEGGPCPDGMFCADGVVCMHAAPPTGPGYGDCVEEPTCANAAEACRFDNLNDVSFGFCSSDCSDASQCADPPATGNAPVACVDLTGRGGDCLLDCSAGQVCPDGMQCAQGSFCAWPRSGYADCASLSDNVCLAAESCVSGFSQSGWQTQVCAAADCADPQLDCPPAPLSGSASPACHTLAEEDSARCVLDCSAEQTCPDGAVCTVAGFCAYERSSFQFQEDFSGGELPPGWVVHDVDGRIPAAGVPVVSQAWSVLDPLEPGEYWAVSTSHYTPPGTADDWMISPEIALATDATLVWSAFSWLPEFPDGYEVYVVPTSITEFADFVAGGDPTAFFALDPVAVPWVEPVFQVAAELAYVQTHRVELPAELADAQVRVAFRNITSDGSRLLLGNVAIHD